ncbi:hypothetical protein [Streptomyces canus]|uniref:hypothetical protein n=1 Tax=Streptomyces canus TaxID=58343 RepID=UPI0027D8586F|nr:hypothetical protein [Streptomyces canus]
MGIERGQGYGEVHGKVVEGSEQCPAVDGSEPDCGTAASLIGEHGDSGPQLLSAQPEPGKCLLGQQHVVSWF